MSPRINAYCTRMETGNLSVDIEGLAMDLISAFKGAEALEGIGEEDSKKAFMKAIEETWNEVKVQVTFDKKSLS